MVSDTTVPSFGPSSTWSTASLRRTLIGHPRRVLQFALGLVWLLDAALQYQPFMFTKAFPQQIIAPTGPGSPSWISQPVHWSATLMSHHIVVWDALFATIQLAIAIGLFWPKRAIVKWALAGSIVWALGIWWLGEGIGSLFAGPISPLSGVPGAAVIYAILALIVWPRRHDDNGEPLSRCRTSLADTSVLGAVGAAIVWIALWGLFIFEALRPADRSPSSLHAMVIGMQDGEPSGLQAFDRFAAHPLNHTGTEASIILAVLCGIVLISPFISWLTKPGIVIALVLAIVAIWAVGENFGGILTGQGTDPNTGPLIALLALAYWPQRARGGAVSR